MPLGRFLRALHRVPVVEASRNGVGPDRIGRLEMGRRAGRARELLATLVERRVIARSGGLEELLDAASDPIPVRGDTLVHGDLYARHLVLDRHHRLCGVIDWGDVHIGDPAVDLAVVHNFLPADSREAFAHGYGKIDDRTWKLSRLRAACHTLSALAHAVDVGDTDLTVEMQGALSRLSAA